MASAKELKKKIRSISNTKKITRTMELVATAKSKRTQDRVHATAPYAAALRDILRDLAQADPDRHPFLKAPAGVRRTAVFVVSANRGLCGGHNTNVLALAERIVREEEAAGRAVDVYMAGKKGISRFRFLGIPIKERYLKLDDRSTFRDAEEVASALMSRYLAGEVGKVLAVFTSYLSASSQKPAVTQVLPVEPSPVATDREGRKPGRVEETVDYIFEPDPRKILDALLPLSVKTAIYRAVVESAASEQIARRLAMKMATDNAEEMIRYYNRTYNRSRQAGITQQINEIVSGANALE